MCENVRLMTEPDPLPAPGVTPTPGRGLRAGLVLRVELLGWSLLLLLASAGAFGLLVLWSMAAGLVLMGAGLPVTLLATVLVRWFADRHRAWAGQWVGEPVARPYLPIPEGNWLTQLWVILRDPATWRDWTWLAVDSVAGWFTAGGSFLTFATGVFYLLYPLVFALTPAQVFRTPLGPHFHLQTVAGSFVTVPLGLVLPRPLVRQRGAVGEAERVGDPLVAGPDRAVPVAGPGGAVGGLAGGDRRHPGQ